MGRPEPASPIPGSFPSRVLEGWGEQMEELRHFELGELSESWEGPSSTVQTGKPSVLGDRQAPRAPFKKGMDDSKGKLLHGPPAAPIRNGDQGELSRMGGAEQELLTQDPRPPALIALPHFPAGLEPLH